VEDFYWYLLHSTATHAFPEGIYYKRRFAWGDTIPHGLGASNFAFMLRHMLIHERGDELHLLMAVPDGWLAEGQIIRIERAPTHFGLVSLRVTGSARGVQVKFDPSWRQPPKRIVLHLPESRPLSEPVGGLDVVVRTDQRNHWDFPAVVRLYRDRAVSSLKPIPSLVSLPLESAEASDRYRMLDLSLFANTNPLTAPFGVENPGRYVFKDLPLGVQTIGGVPFRIVNPADNAGRSFLVLDSPQAPQNRPWPRAIEIPVKQQGRRVFFLGNVHGWSAQDAGTGEWGAVAEYVIRYADGHEQIVPLITGRTADDWAQPPEAEEAFVGLQGDPWHLNVLGVELRDVPVEAIQLRDLGTPAAPVLVAVTLQY
ncbi:MAG: hypothetical protein ABFD90_19290, partial [Phycisphaerales bacterium]